MIAPTTVPIAGDRHVPWMKLLPTNWQFKPLKYLCQINARSLPEDTPAEQTIKYIDIGNVDSDGKVGEVAEIVFGEAPSRARRILASGDVFISTVRTYLTAIAYADAKFDGHICSTGFAVLTPGTGVEPRFLYYWTRLTFFVSEIVARSTGVSYPAINATEIGQIPFPVLARSEQRSIAAFLDRKTAEIDAVVAKKERMIELLLAERQALISRAVTHGLDASVPMKDSSVPWLGKIPQHWQMVRLKFLSRIQTGITLGKTYSGETLRFPYLRVANVQDGSLSLDEITEIDVPQVEAERSTLRAGDVLLTEGGDLDKLGRGTVWSGQIPNCLHQNHVFAVRPTPSLLLAEFLAYQTKAKHGREYFTLTGQKTTNLASTNTTKVGAFPIPLPPVSEQKRICDYIDREASRIDGIIEKNEQQIAKLREYRQTLISAAVTGKYAIPLEETPDFRAAVLAAGRPAAG
jgi:type I restriction enzyme S subunit